MSMCLVFNPHFLRPLEPALSENESFDLLKVCVNNVISLPPETHTPEKTKDEETLDPKQRKVNLKTVHTFEGRSYLKNVYTTYSETIQKIIFKLKLTLPDPGMQALYKETLAALRELLKSVLAKDPTPDGLQSVFKVKPSASDQYALLLSALYL